MKTDRELLELAAKAAGLALIWQYETLGIAIPTVHSDLWNPLTDDGDALWLAVALGIVIRPELECGITNADFPGINALEPHGDDPYAATRRAIVRAAAAIGEAMP